VRVWQYPTGQRCSWAYNSLAVLLHSTHGEAPDWRSVVESIEGAVLVLDLQGRILLANRAVQRYTATPGAELSGQYLWELPEVILYAQQIQTLFAAALDGSGIKPFHLPLTSLDGNEHVLLWHNQFLRNPEGEPTHVLLTGIDITRQQQVEAALREREQHYRFALRSAQAVSWERDLTTGSGTWSEAAPDLYGIDPTTTGASLERWRNLVHPEDKEADARLMERMLAEKWETFETERRIIHPTKGVRWLLSRGRIIYSAQGEPVQMVGIDTDVTERKHTQQVLEESEARFRFMADAAPVLMWVSDASKACTFFNQGWLRFTGRTMDQELGFGWAEGVHPEDYDRCLAVYISAFDARQPFRMDHRLKHHDGTYRWVMDEAVPRYEPDGTFVGYIGSCIDIHDRKMYEASLVQREAEERHLKEQAVQESSRLQAVLEVLPAGVFICNRDGQLITTNPAARELWGGDAPLVEVEDTQFGIYPAWKPDGTPLEAHEWGMIRALQGEVVVGQEVRIRCLDGTSKTILNYARPIEDAQGNRYGAVAVSIDVTKVREVQQAQRRAELEHALAEQLSVERRKLGRELHDGIRQQLVGIQMLSTSLNKKLKASGIPEASLMEEFTRLVADTSLQVRELISGLVPVKVAAEHLFPALQRSAANIEQWYGLSCRCHKEGGIHLKDDEVADHLFHIAQEAMTNAAKHSKATGITVLLHGRPTKLSLSVMDDGVGLPEDYEKMGGMGVSNMQSRAEIIGATLKIISSDQGGAAITCELTLDA
jgi:PAS domain S-box-containing protein